jgi:hypothetical protein
MQLVIFLPTFNAPCMRLKIRCDGWKRKYFGFAWQLNRALDRCTEDSLNVGRGGVHVHALRRESEHSNTTPQRRSM